MKITILQYAFRQMLCVKQKFSDVNFSISTASCLKQERLKQWKNFTKEVIVPHLSQPKKQQVVICYF